MTRTGRNIIAALMLCILIVAVSGCNKKEGPMEQVGKEIDKVTKKTGQQINKAVEKTGEKVEKAGVKIKNSVK